MEIPWELVRIFRRNYPAFDFHALESVGERGSVNVDLDLSPALGGMDGLARMRQGV
jgi:hypothetical protein